MQVPDLWTQLPATQTSPAPTALPFPRTVPVLQPQLEASCPGGKAASEALEAARRGSGAGSGPAEALGRGKGPGGQQSFASHPCPRHQEQADAAQLTAPPASPQGQLRVHGEHEQGAHPNITRTRELAEQRFPASLHLP